MLALDANKLTHRIHQFEDRIDEIWADSLSLKTFQNVEKYPVQVADLAQKLTQEFIFLFIYKNHQLVHWSNNIYVPVTDLGLKKTKPLLLNPKTVLSY